LTIDPLVPQRGLNKLGIVRIMLQMQNAHGRFHFRPFPSLDTTSTSDI
jgi:hypothetical protein